jgi:hypothetical protein
MELVATRALLHIKAFQHIPSEESISLSDLAAATKCQEAVLGQCCIYIPWGFRVSAAEADLLLA